MTDFLLFWIVGLLALISVQFQTLAQKKEGYGRGETMRETISVLVTSFLIALTLYGIVNLIDILVLHLPHNVVGFSKK